MNVLLTSRKYHPSVGGIENSIKFIAKELLKNNHKPIIFCEKTHQGLLSREEIDGVTVLRHPKYFCFLKMREDINYLHKLKNEIIKTVKEEKIDFVLSRQLYYTYAFCRIKLNIPFVYYVPTIFPVENYYNSRNQKLRKKFNLLIKSILQKYLENSAIKNSSKISVLSDNMKNLISHYYEIAPEKINVIPPGVDHKKFNKRKVETEFYNEIGINNKDKIILTVTRFDDCKNVLGLLKEFKKIESNLSKNVKIIILGNGGQFDKIKKYIRQNTLSQKIILPGYRSDVEKFYNIAYMFVNPSYMEGFGQVYIEAMASGVPCIGFRKGFPIPKVATEEIIENNKTGLLADYKKNGDLGDKIKYLINNDALARKMGLEGMKIVREKYSWEKTVSQLLKLTVSNA